MVWRQGSLVEITSGICDLGVLHNNIVTFCVADKTLHVAWHSLILAFNGVIALILSYFTDFDSSGGRLHQRG